MAHGARDTHPTLPRPAWGPDGWLYGRCVIHAPSARRPGPRMPHACRSKAACGAFSGAQSFRVLTHGTTNPWGHDWDKHGEGFFINTVTGHLWHLIPGAHLVDANPSLNPGVYERLNSIADHWHLDKTGGRKALSDGTADSLGGGHAHIADESISRPMPPAFRTSFHLNMHGRARTGSLERHGSSYIGRHEPDVFPSADPWFRGLEISTGPDGSGYILDWSDVGECHEATGVHRTSGRIFKITHGTPQRPSFDNLAKLTTEGAERLLRNPNVWFERQCRRQIAEESLPDGLAESSTAAERGKRSGAPLRAL